MQINIDEIKVKGRIRKNTGNLEPLKDSLKRYGLLNPITLNANKELIAGERRLEAAKQLGWTTINAEILDTSNKITQLEIELEENNQRLPFTDEELYEGYSKLQKLKNPGFWKRLWQAIVNFFKRIFGVKK